jgi:hypothetical protein
VDAGPVRPEPAADGDPEAHLVELPSPGGPVTLVAPPGSPVWRTGPVPAGYDSPEWRSRD